MATERPIVLLLAGIQANTPRGQPANRIIGGMGGGSGGEGWGEGGEGGGGQRGRGEGGRWLELALNG